MAILELNAETETAPDASFTPDALKLPAELARGVPVALYHRSPYEIQILATAETIWAVTRRPDRGGVALRAVPPMGTIRITNTRTLKDGVDIRADSAAGRFDISIRILDDHVLHVETAFTPASNLLIPFWPRDLFVLDSEDDPRAAQGRVEAAQRGLNTGLCFFRLTKPAFGDVLYLQDLTRLNDYFAALGVSPDGVVGGAWPELGYQPPAGATAPESPRKPLIKGRKVVISSAFLALAESAGPSEQDSAAQFLNLHARLYPHLEKPEPRMHDWRARAAQTVRDLEQAPAASLELYGNFYLHAYTASEHPDSMVQLAVLRPLYEHGRNLGLDGDLAERLFAGMERFYDPSLKTVRRYLPEVLTDQSKNADAVDSWYLYHPLLNLGRMALAGHEGAADLFRRSIGFAIEAAHRFDYQWPIQFDIRSFRTLTEARDQEGYGQTDVGGIYAYVMLQAHALFGGDEYLQEAKNALKRLEGLRFELVYQLNLTAWGAVACARLHRLDNDDCWLKEARVFLAGFFHNCAAWNSRIGHAAHFTNFLGATCLHDAQYMAAYECFESFDALQEYLSVANGAEAPADRVLIEAYCLYGLDRGWYFYPDALPEEALAHDKIRNGYIDRDLSFPLEDLYADGQKAGQVGQEIYGAGGAFIFAAHQMRKREGSPD